MSTPARSPAGGASAEQMVAWIGRFAAPLLAVAVYLALPPDALSHAGRATAAVGVLMAVLWMTEALPIPATALIPLALFPLLDISPIRDAAAPYADPFIFLFLGGFVLALAMERWGLHKRIALLTVLAFGSTPAGMTLGFMVATALLSMWVSNTATTVMMLPIAVSVIHLIEQRTPDAPRREHEALATGLLLAIAYAASIGGVGTIIGTPPNVFLAGFLRERYDVNLGFAQWMLVGVPFAAVFLIITWLLLTRVLHRSRLGAIEGGRAVIAGELRSLGPVSRAEVLVMIVFVFAAVSWIAREPLASWGAFAEAFPWITRINDAAIAIIAALLLFALPVEPRRGVFVMDWKTAESLPWGVLLLFGGGLTLASAVRQTGLDSWIGAQVGALGFLPGVLLVASTVAIVIFLTELTSNTATAATFLPILAGAAVGLELAPAALVVPAAIAASCAFMMPVATPPNAIVFGSGRLRIASMVRAGLILNLIGVALITLLAYTLIPLVLGGTVPAEATSP